MLVDQQGFAGVVAAMAVTTLAVAVLYSAWRQTGPWRVVSVLAGVALWLVASRQWCQSQGIEFGVTLVLLWTAVSAWGVAIATATYRPRKGRRSAVSGAKAPGDVSGRPALRALIVVLVLGPIAAAVCALVGALLTQGLSWDPANRALAGIVLMLAAWVGLALWVSTATQLRRPAAWCAAAGLGAALLWAAVR